MSVLAGLLGLSVFLLVVGAITLGGRVTSLANANRALTEELFRNEQEIRQLRPRLEASERELQMLMEGRLPNLHSLIPDQVIQVQEQYIKNIVFTVVNQGEDKTYEYKLVMDNPAHLRIQPRFRVLVFDRMGVQVGVDEVELGDALGAGESRSHASTLDVFMNSQPRYFAIDFNGRARSNGDQ
ncbi:MAG: hypothetical protein OQK27_04205 [Gammaproteobacteria bacterium]|nr:hypothetical protein [Gammaproteobacteria bacterium]